MPPQRRSTLPAECLRSASTLLPCLQSKFLRRKCPVPFPLLRIRRARRGIFPPVLCPSRDIVKLARETQMLLFPYLAPLSGPHAFAWVRESSCSIFSFTRARASPAATRIAFFMAFAFDLPCEITHTPRTPSNGAPPYSE